MSEEQLTVFAHPVSQPSRAVLHLLAIKEVKHAVKVLMPGVDTREPTFTGIFPLGYIPAIELKKGDDDAAPFRLVEGAAILEFLAEKYGWKDMVPTDAQHRAQMRSIMHWHHSASRPITHEVFFPLVRNLMAAKGGKEPVPIDAEAFKKELDGIDSVIADLCHIAGWNGQKDDSPFVVRGHGGVSLADFLVYCEFDQLMSLNIGDRYMGKFPKFKTWVEAMRKLPLHDETRSVLNEICVPLKKFLPADLQQ